MIDIGRRTLAKLGLIVAAGAMAPSKLRAATRAAATGLQVAGLRVEGLVNPLGLDVAKPHLSWQLISSQRNVRQSAYRLVVGSSAAEVAAGRGDLWDTGRVASDQSLDIVYKGHPLPSRQRCWWTVQVWDEAGRSAPLPASSSWEMGLLSPTDWTASWLTVESPEEREDREAGMAWIWGPTPKLPGGRYFRLGVDFNAPVREAVLITGARDRLAGVYLDGAPLAIPAPQERFGLDPLIRLELGPLAAGRHLLGAEVAVAHSDPFRLVLKGVGAFAALLRVRYNDGRVERFTTVRPWRTSSDTNPRWAELAYDDQAWAAAQPASISPNVGWPPSPARYLRTEFGVDRPVVAARLYATALGAYDVFLNGDKVGDALLAPECQDFRKRVRYRVYDVTGMIRAGVNGFGAHVGDGWYASFVAPGARYSFGPAPRRFIGQLELTFADRSRHVVATGPGWRADRSPVLAAEIYDGETYDARQEQVGWSAPGFNAAAWSVADIGEPPHAPLTAQVDPPIRVSQTLAAKSVTQPKPGAFVFDFGQNFAGICRLLVTGPAGTKVTLRFAEVLLPNGEVDQSNLRTAKATDSYTLKGSPAGESWRPTFTYHGFRYVQVEGFPGKPTAANLEGQVIHTDLPITGELRIDNPLIEQFWRNTVWSQRSNFVGIPTDCPQRDERLGWLGDANAFWDAAAFNMDVYAFTARFAEDMRDAQGATGGYPDFCPIADPVNDQPSPGWADAGVSLPWTAWIRSGDTSVIDQQWDSMVRYLHYIEAANPDHVWRNARGHDWGDWLALDSNPKNLLEPTTPKDLVGTAWWACSTERVIQMAEASGRKAEADVYRAMHAAIVAAFQAAFVKPDGTVGNGSQTGYILSLRFGLIPPALRMVAGQHLCTDIERRGGTLSTGFLGTPHSLDVLADIGRPDLVYNLLLRTAFPSWGYMIAKGATSIWERWNGDVGDVSMNSFNHYALGAVSGFLFRRIAGIDLGAPGFKEVVVRPVLDPRITRGGGTYQSAMGRISTGWEQGPDSAFRLTVEIPANATGRIHLPAKPRATIREGRRVLPDRKDQTVRRAEGEVIVHVGSGRYQFTVDT
jgi:alpha-L-rhamnosidase